MLAVVESHETFGTLALVRPASERPALVYLARLAPGSRRTMAQALDTMAGLLSPGATAADLPWESLRYGHTQALRARLAESFAPATANKFLCALRGVLQEAWRLGLLESEDFRRASDLEAVKGSTLPRGRALAAGEVRALFGQGDGPTDRRDAAIVAVLYGCGLRRSELVALDVADWNPVDRALAVRHGKGNKARQAFLPAGAAVALTAWLEARGEASGPLFVGIRRGGNVQTSRLSDQAILHILQVRGEAAGVAPFSPHDLRRTFISDLLDAGADIATVQQMAGHASVTTTARYDRRGDAAKKRAADLLHVPTAGGR